ncbi:hypothetical protein ACS0TY_002687 [Phlomoides rotata]
MAWRSSLSRSLMPAARASSLRSLTPRSAAPRLCSPSVSSSAFRRPLTDTVLRSSPPLSSFRLLFTNHGTLGHLGCTRSLSPLHSSMVAGTRMTSHLAIKMSDKRNLLDKKRRLLARRYELRRKFYKALLQDPDLPSVMRDKVRNRLSQLPRNSSFTRIRNRCVFTGRPRSVYKKFRMSRIIFRELANQGQLQGVKKASW